MTLDGCDLALIAALETGTSSFFRTTILRRSGG
jgi:hypothetical protein